MRGMQIILGRVSDLTLPACFRHSQRHAGHDQRAWSALRTRVQELAGTEESALQQRCSPGLHLNRGRGSEVRLWRWPAAAGTGLSSRPTAGWGCAEGMGRGHGGHRDSALWQHCSRA